jgi:hypothetical protein
VAYLLKAKPEKQPLLANGSETTFVFGNGGKTINGTTFVARQQIHDKRQLKDSK